MTDNSTTPAQQSPAPALDLKSLDRLVGKWRVSGPEIDGFSTFEWLDGGFFLIQHIDFVHSGHQVKGMEVIGHLHLFGAEPSEDIKSRYYGSTGETFDYVYELEGDTLTIWGDEKGSPAYYKAKFSSDGNTFSGAWVYPDGGGYEATSTRL